MSHLPYEPSDWAKVFIFGALGVACLLYFAESFLGVPFTPLVLAVGLGTMAGVGVAHTKRRGWFPIGVVARSVCGLLAFGCLVGQGWVVIDRYPELRESSPAPVRPRPAAAAPRRAH